MHISDGVISGEICIASAAAAAGIAAICLKKTKQEEIPRIAVVTAVIFVSSLIHVKIGPSSAHLLLNGLAGILLGISAFPAILISLLFQAIMFQHGGITTLGANTLAIGMPALISAGMFHIAMKGFPGKVWLIRGVAALAGVLSIFITGCLMAGFLMATGEAFSKISTMIIAIHVPIAIVEGIITAMTVSFLYRVKPEVLSAGT